MPTIRKVRQQGGARIVTLPNALLVRIGAGAGTSLSLDVVDGAIVATPIADSEPPPRRRYTLAELLVGAEHLQDVYRDVSGALDGGPIGGEIG